MTEYHFNVIVKVSEMTHEEILDVADRFGNAGCTDASIGDTEMALNCFSVVYLILCSRL